MGDFRKALSKLRYDFVKEHMPEQYQEIIAFSSTFGGTEEISLKVRAKVEDYCMGLAKRMYERGCDAGH